MRAFLVIALKVVGTLLVGALLVLTLGAAGLWWWAGTQSSLEWALRQVEKSQNLQVQGLTGSLRTGLNAQHLQWEREGLLVEAVDAQLAWQPLALLRSTLRLDHLRAARLRIEDRRPPQPSVAPQGLALPLRVELGELSVGQLQWVARGNSIEAGDLAARYSFDLARHHVELARLRWAGGNYSGEGSLGVDRPMPVQARLQGRLAITVPGGTADVPLALIASVDGPLADMLVRAEILGLPDSPVANASAMATARVTPWAAQALAQVQAEFRQLDAAALWKQAPHTALSGRARAQPGATGAWTINLETTNAIPGPWDQRRLPFGHLSTTLEWQANGLARVRTLQAQVGEGEVSASGELQRDGSWIVNGQLRELNPAAILSGLASTPLSGTAQLKGDQRGVDFEVAVSAIGEPAPGSSQAGAALAALELRSASARGRWSEGRLSLPAFEVSMSDASLRGSAELQPLARAGSGKLTLVAPGLTLMVDGKISETVGAGRAQLASTSLPHALGWLARLPGIPDELGMSVAEGRAEAQLVWQGGWRNPGIEARLVAPLIEMRGNAPAWIVRDLTASVDGRLSDAQLRLHARAEQGQRRAGIDAAAKGGRRGPQENAPWQGQLTALDVTASDPAVGNGPWTLKLSAPVDWRWSGGRFEAGEGRALLHAPRAATPAQLAWNTLAWSDGELRTAGRLQGLPLAWIELVGGAQLGGSAVTGDLVFDAEWDAALGATPRVRASLVRSRGDITVLAESGQGQAARVAAGVRDALLVLEVNGEVVTFGLRWDSERAGTAEGRVATKLTRAGDAMWQWPPDAPLGGSLHARLPRIGVWSLLAPPGWRLRGSLAADVTVAGTRADPQLSGTLTADNLALRSVVDGFEMQGGRLRASLGGQRVLIDEFILHGPGTDGGTVNATGEAIWTPSGPQLRMTAKAERLRASTRSDRQLTVSGTLAAQRDASGTVINGNLRVDKALIVLPDEGTPKLGDDVVVRGSPMQASPVSVRAEEPAARGEDRLQMAVEVDLGDDFRVRGKGIDTRLTGSLTVSGQSLASPRLVGTILTRGGEYQAYGQRLEIERGQIRFTGPIDNPVLDILAVRPNMPQQTVGVRVSGTALAPRVQLYSDPDLPDAEKLAWLVTGRASPEGGAESALLQEAALALLTKRAGGPQGGFAGTFGLDQLSVRREGTEGAAVTLGKRFGRNLYAAYERSLSGAVGTLSLFYDVTRRLTVRAQTGERTALDLIYTFTFD